MTSLIAPRRTRRLLTQVAAVLIAAAAVAIGVWVAGGLVTDDFRGSVALTTVWFAVSGGPCLLVALRRPELRAPVNASYLMTAGAVGAVLASTTLRDRVVAERVVNGAAPGDTGPRPSAGASRAPAPRPRNVQLARGRFTPGEHATRGTAAIVRVADGRRFLTLTSFSTSPGPDLRVRLASSRTLDGGSVGAVDLGAIKGNRGDQQYRILPSATSAGAPP